MDMRRVRPGANITLKETLEEPRQRRGNGGGFFRAAWVNKREEGCGGGLLTKVLQFFGPKNYFFPKVNQSYRI